MLYSHNSQTAGKKQEQELPYTKRILIVDDDPDITLTFKTGLESANNDYRKFEVNVFNDSLKALSNFKSDFYDLLLVDITMPNMTGFELSEKIIEKDANIKVCFISARDLNIEALREVHPKISTGSFISKPIEMKELVRRIDAELD